VTSSDRYGVPLICHEAELLALSLALALARPSTETPSTPSGISPCVSFVSFPLSRGVACRLSRSQRRGSELLTDTRIIRTTPSLAWRFVDRRLFPSSVSSVVPRSPRFLCRARSLLAIISRGSGELCRCGRRRKREGGGGRRRRMTRGGGAGGGEEDGKTERDGESGRHEGEI